MAGTAGLLAKRGSPVPGVCDETRAGKDGHAIVLADYPQLMSRKALWAELYYGWAEMRAIGYYSVLLGEVS